MSYYMVQPARLHDAADQLFNVITKVNELKNNVFSVARNLDGDTRLMANVKKKVNAAANDMTNVIFAINTLRLTLNEAVSHYENTENRIVSNTNDETINTDPFFIYKRNPYYPAPTLGPTYDPDGKVIKPNDTIIDEIADITNKIKDFITLISKYSDNEIIETLPIIGSISGFISNIMNLADPDADRTPSSFVADLLDLAKSTFSIGDKGFDLAGKETASFISGAVGNGLGIISDIADLWDDSVSDKLKNADDLINDVIDTVNDFVTKGKDISKADAAKNNVTLSALTSLISMAAYAGGDIYQKVTDDGVYDLNDYGDTLLGTGIKGADALMSALTFGLIDIDTESSVKKFQGNTAAVAQMIKDTGAPLAVQVLMSVPATAGVAVYSAAEVFVDMGKKIGETINNVISFFKKK